jgi:HEPN domain-containing protein
VKLSPIHVSRHVALLSLPREAQTLIHAHDIPETRLRYLLQALPRPKYTAQIIRLLTKATHAELWSSEEFHAEVDRVLHRTAEPAWRPAQTRTSLERVRTQMAAVFKGKAKSDPAYLREQLDEKDLAEFDQLAAEATKLLTYLEALSAYRRQK